MHPIVAFVRNTGSMPSNPTRHAAGEPRPDAEQLALLLGRVAGEDTGALEQLYSRTASPLLGFALRLLRRRELAEEVLQDSFVSIWQHAGEYRREYAQPMTWMIAIVRNRALDQLRRRGEQMGSLDEQDTAEIEDPDPGPAQRLIDTQDRRLLGHCMKELDGVQRQAIALAYFRGLSHGEMADHLSVPLGTVKTWVRRGLARLRDCLGRRS